MSAQGKFIIFCAEQYKAAKHLTGKQLSELFGKYHVWEYLYSCFEALHTTGTNYMRYIFTICVDFCKKMCYNAFCSRNR